MKKYLGIKVAGIILAGSTALPVIAGATESLEKEVERLTTRLNVLENKSTSKIPSLKTTLKVSGYIQADIVHHTNADNGAFFDAGLTPKIPESANTELQANQSRLNISTTSYVNGKPFLAAFEFDGITAEGNEVFSNSIGVRFRHAYIKYDKYLIGQFWSNFQDSVAVPLLLDISSPAGRVFVRQTQFRYTTGQWAFSLENSETQAIQGLTVSSESLGGVGKDTIPDIIASWRGGNGGSDGSFQISGVLRTLGIDGTVNEVDYSDTHTGWGLNAAGNWKFGSVTLKANAAYGDGIGRYINNGWANDVRLNSDGTTDVITSLGYSAAIEKSWSSKYASTLSYGHFESLDDIGAFGTQELNTYRANLRYTFDSGTMLGGEIMFAEREWVDGDTGDNTRIQISVRHKF